jgi:UrcA family protein
MNRTIAFVCALLFASVTVSSACFANPTDDGVRLVTYDDLDLSTANGLAKLDQRIRRAADWVCLDPASSGPVAQVNSACRQRALAEARAQVASLLAKHAQFASNKGVSK